MTEAAPNPWFYADLANQQQGPVDSDTLLALLELGKINQESLVWTVGMETWQPLKTVMGTLAPAAAAEQAAPQPEPEAEPVVAVPEPEPETFAVHTPAVSEPELTAAPAEPEPTPATVVSSPVAPVSTPVEPVNTQASPAPQAAAPQPTPQPAYQAAPQATPQAAPVASPPKKNRGCLIAAIVGAVLVVIGIPIIGILAAIALPAYQDYTLRAKVAETVTLLSPYKVQMAEFHAEHGRCPLNGEGGIPERDAFPVANVTDVFVGNDTDDDRYDCIIVPTLTGFGHDALDGEDLWMSYDAETGDWLCGSTAPDRYLPSMCKG